MPRRQVEKFRVRGWIERLLFQPVEVRYTGSLPQEQSHELFILGGNEVGGGNDEEKAKHCGDSREPKPPPPPPSVSLGDNTGDAHQHWHCEKARRSSTL